MNYLSINKYILLFISSLSISCISSLHEIGQPYKGWKEGEIDIHHIYTGRGESNFFIFPDGTTMLVDAGDWDPNPGKSMLEILPDSTKRSGEWIARYINSLFPEKDTIDYLIISHFDSDHIGSAENMGLKLTKNRNPNYLITGVSHVGEFFHFKKVIDRDYPTYDFPISYQYAAFKKDFENYKNYLDWTVKTKGTKIERFMVGSNCQISLAKDPRKYSNFSIRNIIGNGVLWIEKCQSLDSLYFHRWQPCENMFNENTMSIGFVLSFGKFKYFTAGDLSGSVRDANGKDIGIEGVMGRVCGPVNVVKANHHSYLDAMSEEFVKNMQADFIVVPVWELHHLQPATIKRMGLLGSRIFFTRFPKSKREEFKGNDWMNNVADTDGHVIIKVIDNGKKYLIYVLNASSEAKEVKAVYGPFKS